jgi:hypothetical protein
MAATTARAQRICGQTKILENGRYRCSRRTDGLAHTPGVSTARP